MIITIDGPTASGKSSVAKQLAKQLGFFFLGTGSMFRAVAYLLTEFAGYSEEMLRFPQKKDLQVYLDPQRFIYKCDGTGAILFDDQDITPFLKTSQMDRAASIISVDPNVRDVLLALQRRCVQGLDFVIEGRDVGSVVFPNADIKFFLTASVAVRAKRWQLDQQKKGASFLLEQAIAKISSRDERDSMREVAPLIKPNGAVVIDNSDMTLQETVEKMMQIIKEQSTI